MDGVLITGAAGDVDPSRYGAEPPSETHPVAPLRDEFELALVHAAEARDMPLLGICRGMEVLNVAHGGTLEQHLPDAVGHDDHARRRASSCATRCASSPARWPPRRGRRAHRGARLSPPGRARGGEGLRPTAWSDLEDGIVEGIERPDRAFALGVLWHPEEDETSRVIAALARRRSTLR